MPSPAFARPLWPATLCALRELTRLALASLVLAVGLGGAVAADPPGRSTAVSPPSATVTLGAPPTAVAAVRPTVGPVRAVDAGQRREPATSAPVGPAGTDGTSAAAVQVGHRVAPVPAVRAGESTRRGPPTG
ncbi:hypothetical protein O3597_22610 [Verrucosispora sp. WMMA2044]|uniref:hypothetical protein n=1 Tax=Verrucosispora sp. WMMA2044 TaxID=3016419 RepID=UPI00248C615D|nr:hypothetical protein [Verrucosispora sp. WMMA2044]WBB47885.1 hypothetical protein O3597_22610 [Verrucosispora sp. WMMA2044]